MATMEEVSLENVLIRCGDFGRYQLIHFCFLCLLNFSSGMTGFYYVFALASPSFRCRLPIDKWPDDNQYQAINASHQLLINEFISPSSKCEYLNESMCNDYVFDRSVYGKTFTEEAHFVCDNALKKTWISTVYEIGTFILLIINQLVSGIDPYGVVFLLIMELTSSSHTSFAAGVALVAYTIGEVIITGFAYLASNWLNLKWLMSAYYAITIPYLYFIPESPYWLFTRKKYDELEVCLRKIAKANNREESEWLPHYTKLIQESRTLKKPETKIKSKKRQKVLRFLPRLVLCGCIEFVTMLLYTKITYGLAAMNEALSPYLNFIIGAGVEGLGYLVAGFAITTVLGRKYSLIIFAILTAICVLIIPFITESYPIVATLISQIGKFGVSSAVSVSWLYVPELFPTYMRGLANGIFVFVGSFGSMLAPIVDTAVGEKHGRITHYVYSGLTVLLALVITTLPETRDRSFDDGQQSDDFSQSEDDSDSKY